jgi:hypothetical protein
MRGDVNETARRSVTAEYFLGSLLTEEQTRVGELAGGGLGFDLDAGSETIGQAKHERVCPSGGGTIVAEGENSRAGGVGNREFVGQISFRSEERVEGQMMEEVVRGDDEVMRACQTVADGREEISV